MPGCVLIVENEPLVREAMADILVADGFEAIAASSGDEGVAAFKRSHHQIDLVILDMRLPGMDGPAVLRALRDISPCVKALISSAYDEEEVKQGFNGLPVESILRKPFDAGELLDSVRGLIAA